MTLVKSKNSVIWSVNTELWHGENYAGESCWLSPLFQNVYYG